MTDPIKLVIWDMDDTFWKGTLSDGEVEPIVENISLVKFLSKRGIVSSICSKNNYADVKDELKKQGVWDFFVFPSMEWEAIDKNKQIDTFPLFAILDRPAYFSTANSYTPEGNRAVAELIAKSLDL